MPCIYAYIKDSCSAEGTQNNTIVMSKYILWQRNICPYLKKEKAKEILWYDWQCVASISDDEARWQWSKGDMVQNINICIMTIPLHAFLHT